MIRVTFLYPKTDESTFDMDYYTSTHMPMLTAALGDDCQSWGADKITSGPYEAIGWALVSSAEAFEARAGVIPGLMSPTTPTCAPTWSSETLSDRRDDCWELRPQQTAEAPPAQHPPA